MTQQQPSRVISKSENSLSRYCLLIPVHNLLVFTFLIVGTSGDAVAQVEFLYSFGQLGDGDGQISNPRGIAVSNSGNVYITDSGTNCCVQVYDEFGEFKFSFGSRVGSSDGAFDNEPWGIEVDDNGWIYVTDIGGRNQRVQVFDETGTFQFAFGGHGSGEGEFSNPSDIAISDSGNIFVADFSNDRVQVFDSLGTFLYFFGDEGALPGDFNGPSGIALDNTGNVYVTEQNNNRIQILSDSGTPLISVDAYSPRIDVDGKGNIYLANGAVYDNDGNHLYSFFEDGYFGIAINEVNDRIYVLNGPRVDVWQIVPEPSSLLLVMVATASIGLIRRQCADQFASS